MGHSDSDSDSDDSQHQDPVDKLLNDKECGELYAAIGECLTANKRDFRHCQAELHNFRDCHAAQQKREKK